MKKVQSSAFKKTEVMSQFFCNVFLACVTLSYPHRTHTEQLSFFTSFSQSYLAKGKKNQQLLRMFGVQGYLWNHLETLQLSLWSPVAANGWWWAKRKKYNICDCDIIWALRHFQDEYQVDDPLRFFLLPCISFSEKSSTFISDVIVLWSTIMIT